MILNKRAACPRPEQETFSENCAASKNQDHEITVSQSNLEMEICSKSIFTEIVPRLPGSPEYVRWTRYHSLSTIVQ